MKPAAGRATSSSSSTTWAVRADVQFTSRSGPFEKQHSSATMKSIAIAVLAAVTLLASAADAHGLRGLQSTTEVAKATEPAAGDSAVWDELVAAAKHDVEAAAASDDDASTVASDSDIVDDGDGDEYGSSAADADADVASAMSYGFTDISGEEKSSEIAGVVPANIRGMAKPSKGEVTQTAAKPLPTTAGPTPAPIGESAAAAKDITSIDKSAIQRDPTSYGIVTTPPAPAATKAPAPTTPAPPAIGESAAAAKDITSIDASAIQRDPKSYGVVTPAPATPSLADSPMAAKPSSTPAPANQSPTQRGS